MRARLVILRGWFMAKKIKKENEATEIKVIPVFFQKDNDLISSKSKMTLLGRKVFDAAIMNVKETVNSKGMPVIKAVISGQELKEFIGADYDSIYTYVRRLIAPKPINGDKAKAPSLLDWKIIIRDDEQKRIIVRNVMTDAEFENGQLTIVFNNELKNKLVGIRNNYTMLNRQIVSKFKSEYSYQLYQFFKQTIDRQAAITKEKGPFELKMDLIDLKAQLGYIDPHEDEILYKAITDESVVTYDAIEGIEDKDYLKLLRDYGTFRANAIERAKKDINKLSDINMDYEPLKRGKGGRKVGFKFIISYKEMKESEESDVEEVKKEVDIFDFIDEMRTFMDIDLSTKDLKSIAEAADCNIDKIKKAYGIMNAVQGGVNNPTGFMIKAIKDGYKETSSARKNRFSNYERRDYDFEQIEAQLLDN